MRFSLQYEHHKLPEWASRYIRYSFLLAVIKPLYSQDSVGRQDSVYAAKIPLMTFLSSNKTRASRLAMASINTLGGEDFFYEHDPLSAWLELLQQDCQRVATFYEEKSREFATELADITDYVSRNLKEMDALLLLTDHQDPRLRVNSLQRAVESCHRHIWNLEVFLEVNGLAFKRLVHKLEKVSSSQRLEFLTSFPFNLRSNQRILAHSRKKIYSFAAEYITHKDIKHTKKLFRRAEVVYNPRDTRAIAFCAGWALVSLGVGLFSMTALNDLDRMIPSFCVYRLIACFMFVLWVSCAVLYVFDYYAINWPSVFEIRRKTAMTFIKLMKTASGWTALLTTFFMVHVTFIVSQQHKRADIVSYAAFLAFLLLWLAPVHFMHLKVRKELGIVLGNIFISPFGKVGFAHFFTADVLTSLSKPIADIYRCFCFISSDAWSTNTQVACPDQLYWIYSLSVVPYVWRFLQCWNRFYYTREWFPHLVNVGKYSFGILTVTVTYFEPQMEPTNTRALLIIIFVLGTLYMMTWDTMMDFGFRRFFTAAGRKQCMYPRWMYIYVSVCNIVLRFTWALTLIPKSWLVNKYLQVEVLLLFVCLLEILRRGQWTLLRIENEKFSNIEKYRNEDFVPKMPKIIVDD